MVKILCIEDMAVHIANGLIVLVYSCFCVCCWSFLAKLLLV